VWLSRADLTKGMEHPLHFKFASAVMDTLKPSFGDTVRNLDDQITETRHLCERINARPQPSRWVLSEVRS